MQIGIFVKGARERENALVTFSLARRSEACAWKSNEVVGDFLADELRRWGVDSIQYPPGFGVVQAHPTDGKRFLAALFLYQRWSHYLLVRPLDDEAQRLQGRVLLAARRGRAQIRRQRVRREVIVCEVTITRRLKYLGVTQQAPLRAIHRFTAGHQRPMLVMSVPRFSSVEVGAKLSDMRVAGEPGRAEMVFFSERDLILAFRKQLHRINVPTPDLVTRYLLSLFRQVS